MLKPASTNVAFIAYCMYLMYEASSSLSVACFYSYVLPLAKPQHAFYLIYVNSSSAAILSYAHLLESDGMYVNVTSQVTHL